MLTIFCHEDDPVRVECPSADELSVIINEVHCKECNKVFDGESRYRMHYLKVHQKKSLAKVHKDNIHYHCPAKQCAYSLTNQKYFSSYKYLKQHYLKVHAEKKFSCSNCTKSFSTTAAKEAHERICGVDFTCECGKIFTSPEALFTHARRNSHTIHEKYKSKRKKLGLSMKQIYASGIITTPILVPKGQIIKHILPKPTCDVAIQTDVVRIKKNSPRLRSSLEKQICRQTQTSETSKVAQMKRSAETQTAKAVRHVIRFHKLSNQKEISVEKHGFPKDDKSPIEIHSSEFLTPDSPLSLRHDIILQDLWEEKNSSGTQTSPEKNIFGDTNECSLQNITHHIVSRSDPMLTEETYTDRFNSTETQTERAFCQSIFETDPLSSHNETQTTENFTETIEPLHIYNDTYTQTCDEIFAQDLELSDIQTQTAWNDLDETTVSTQTKALKCLPGCSESSLWLTAQTNHMETQTDVFQFFEGIG
ncbi:hypothetical protein QAD02_019298 [Eretmocerus hayati]|uniref:Uncharacterized protein n=1 Tax=Eretmocerus hayati TaxID=131215 RepID=A0ACC2PKE4_9HYME|nr:hypothetical protein QAD02_019298 [Eretmocerus hayati]